MSQPVHLVAHFRITDAERYGAYGQAFMATLDGVDAEVVTVDDDVHVLEGERQDGRTVIIRFASEEACLAWWESDAYRAIVADRHAGTETFSISLVHGMTPR